VSEVKGSLLVQYRYSVEPMTGNWSYGTLKGVNK